MPPSVRISRALRDQPAAPAFSSDCDGRFAPGIGMTFRLRRSHASAVCPGVLPWARPIIRSSRINGPAYRAPGEDRDALPFTVGEDLRFDLPLEHVVTHLVRGDVRP